jgi:hypothetical protein
MPTGQSTEEDSATLSKLSGHVPWIVTQVTVRPDFELFVQFRDGTSGPVYMKTKLSRPCGVFEVLRDPQVFATARVEEGDVVWPNGLDLAPDRMYDEIKANGEWVLR